jgi:Nif-specific regulatory protein
MSSFQQDALLASPASPEEVTRLRHERDLYHALVGLAAQDKMERLIDTALRLIAQTSGSRKGYIELLDERAGKESLRWHVSLGCSDMDVEQIQHSLSSGIIAAVVATGKPIVTSSAYLDKRFRDRGSVQRHQIEAALCVPIGCDPVQGVLYLQDRAQSGSFTEADLNCAQTFAGYVSVFVDRLLMRHHAREQADPTREYRKSLRVEGFIGRSPAIARVLGQLALIAPLEVSALFTGGSGTGKTQLARILHENSPRARQPFIELNCAAIPEALVESELFGVMAGAHSTASKRMPGKLDAAAHGSLFLDEVGELSLAAQAKLLQFLQSRQFYPLGSNKLTTADVRVLAATNVDLREAVRERRFREDLLYRLEVLPIAVPSLAERSLDIPELVDFFCARACQTHRFAQLTFSPAALRAAQTAEWPGNVRQLAHAVEAAAIRAGGSGSLAVERRHLFPDLDAAVGQPPLLTFQQATREFQGQLLAQTLNETGWHILQTAERLDLGRSQVYNLIRSFGLVKASTRSPAREGAV